MKKLALGFLLVLLVGFSAGATLEDFDYVYEDGFEVDLTGGETLFMGANFTNAASENVPLGVEVTVEGEDHPMSDSGEEFDISGSLSDVDGSPDYVDLVQTGYKTSEGLGIYRFRLNSTEEVVEGRNSLDLEFKSDVRIRPDSYSFDISIRSVVGLGTTKNLTVSPGEGPETVSFEDTGSSVSLDAGAEDVKVNVTQLSSVTVSPPQSGDEFVGGFTVDKEDQEKDLSGNVKVRYDDDSLDSRDLSVYYYNDSESSWENVGGIHYPSNNSVVAQVDHFSTYAAYAEPEQDEEENRASFTPGFNPSEEQVNETNQTDEQSLNDTDGEEQPPQDDQSEEQTGEDTQQEETQEDTSSAQQPSGPTGLFTANSGSTALGLIAVLFTVIAVLQYTGRIKVQEALSYFRSS